MRSGHTMDDDRGPDGRAESEFDDDLDDFDDDVEDGRLAAGDDEDREAEMARAITEDEIREIDLLVDTLPGRVAQPVRERGYQGLIEIVLDLGRRPTARYSDGEMDLGEEDVKDTELAQVVAQVSEFGDDNR